MGVQSVISDMGVNYKLQVLTDSSAAKRIASRRGLGKVRHIEVNQLWVQEKVVGSGPDKDKQRGQSFGFNDQACGKGYTRETS